MAPKNSGSANRVGAGDITITLEGEEYVLRPTLNAVQTISRQYGGLRGAIDQIAKTDFDVIVTIIRLGLGPNIAKNFKNLPETCYQSGMTDQSSALASKCIEYLMVLMNGGKPMTVSAEAEASDDTQNPPSLN